MKRGDYILAVSFLLLIGFASLFLFFKSTNASALGWQNYTGEATGGDPGPSYNYWTYVSSSGGPRIYKYTKCLSGGYQANGLGFKTTDLDNDGYDNPTMTLFLMNNANESSNYFSWYLGKAAVQNTLNAGWQEYSVPLTTYSQGPCAELYLYVDGTSWNEQYWKGYFEFIEGIKMNVDHFTVTDEGGTAHNCNIPDCPVTVSLAAGEGLALDAEVDDGHLAELYVGGAVYSTKGPNVTTPKTFSYANILANAGIADFSNTSLSVRGYGGGADSDGCSLANGECIRRGPITVDKVWAAVSYVAPGGSCGKDFCFVATQGTGDPPDQTLAITNGPNAQVRALRYQLSETASWLNITSNVSDQVGVGVTRNANISASLGSLAPGIYTANITLKGCTHGSSGGGCAADGASGMQWAEDGDVGGQQLSTSKTITVQFQVLEAPNFIVNPLGNGNCVPACNALTVGDTVDFSGTVKNIASNGQGCATSATTTRVYITDIDNTAIGSDTVASGICGGGTQGQNFNTNWVAIGGTHTLAVCADAASDNYPISGPNAVAESLENDNCATFSFTVKAPDLTAGVPTVSPAGTIYAGIDTVYFGGTVTNGGTVSTNAGSNAPGTSKARLQVNSSNNGIQTTPYKDTGVLGIGVTQTYAMATWNWAPPASQVGSQTVEVCADSANDAGVLTPINDLSELDETNNCTSRTFTTTGVPDLTMTITSIPNPLVISRVNTLSATTNNIGYGNAATSTTRLTMNGITTPSDIATGVINNGASTPQENWSFTPPGPETNYTATFCADIAHVINPELQDEAHPPDNNCSSMSVWSRTAPTVDQVKATGPAYCSSTSPLISWVYHHPNPSRNQGHYQVQVRNVTTGQTFSGDVCSPAPCAYDSGQLAMNLADGATGSVTVPLAAWNTTYQARVKVWAIPGAAGENEVDSTWATMSQCTEPIDPATRLWCTGGNTQWLTPVHRYPAPDFTYSPPDTIIQEPVTFTPVSGIYYVSGNDNKTCSWDFDGNGTYDQVRSTNSGTSCPTETYTYIYKGKYYPTLTATDNAGTCVSPASNIVTITLPIPYWKEVAPQ